MSTPLHQLDPLNRFSDRASDYVKYRPTYPTEAIDQILEGLGTPSQLVAADIGAGTGISARLLGDRELQVWAIEPNAAMSQVAEVHPNVTYRAATAEQTDLSDASVDLITCFQSFHWFDPEPTLAEFRRILKSSGRLALVWNDRDQSNEFSEGYETLLREISDKHHALGQAFGRAGAFPTNPHFLNVRSQLFSFEQTLDQAGLIGNAKSRSYVPQEGMAHDQLITKLTALHQRWANPQGLVSISYQTRVFLADPQITSQP
ncbi:class I SAM-dependent methyltransferase [Phormidesmis sp. 146-12]